MIFEIKHSQLDCQTLADALRGRVEVQEIQDLTGLVPHVGAGGASKSIYVSPKTGRTVYVLERNGMYAPDAYLNDVWQFADDFSVDEAREYLDMWDNRDEIHADYLAQCRRLVPDFDVPLTAAEIDEME